MRRMLLELTDAELVTAASACRAMRASTGLRARGCQHHARRPRYSHQTPGFIDSSSSSPVSKTTAVQIGLPIWSHQRWINNLR
jgi:hypothetical protein